MLETRNILLLKAIAMGALFANGSMGADGKDKQEKELNKPLYKVEVAGGTQGAQSDSDIAYRVREILEERNAKRRDLLRQPRTFDLSVKSVSDVFNHLSWVYEASDNGKYPVKVKALTLLNITEEQLDQILNHENASYIEELQWTYQPIPVALTQDMAEEDEKMDVSEAEKADDTEIPDGKKYEEMLNLNSEQRVSLVKEILDRADERAKIRREILRQRRIIDLSVKPIGDVLEFLHNAHKYSDNDPVKVKLSLLNVTEEQLNKILNNEHANHIEELDWTYQPIPVVLRELTEDEKKFKERFAQDIHRAKFTPVLMQIIARKDQPGKGLKPLLYPEGEGRDVNRELTVSFVKKILDQADERANSRREILRQRRTIDLSIKPVRNVLNVLYYAHQYSDKDPVKVKLNLLNVTAKQLNKILNDENADHIEELEWTYQPIPVAALQDMDEEEEKIEEDDGGNEIPGEDNLADLNNHVQPRGIANLPALRRAVARRRDVPLLAELADFGKKGNFEPIKGRAPIPTKIALQDYKADPTLLSWKITPVKENISNAIPPNLGNPNMHTRHASHNLVNIYCRKAPDMIPVQ